MSVSDPAQHRILAAVTLGMVILSSLVLVGVPHLTDLPSRLKGVLFGLTFALLALSAAALAGRRAGRARSEWARARGLERSNPPDDLVTGMSCTARRRWDHVRDPGLLAGEHRGRRVAVYVHPGSSDMRRRGRMALRGAVVAVAETEVPLPLIEVERRPSGRPPVAFGAVGGNVRVDGLPDSVTVSCDDTAYAAAVAGLLVEHLPTLADELFTVALDGRRVVAWSRRSETDRLLSLVCNVAEALPREILDRFGAKP